MKKYLLPIIILLTISFGCAAISAEDRMNIVFTSGKWSVVEFTMPTDLLYRVGASSNLSQQNSTLYVDISTVNNCMPNNVVMNKYLGSSSNDFASTPFLPISYKVNGENTVDTAVVPTISNGYLFFNMKELNQNPLLSSKGKGNIAFWITPPKNNPEKLKLDKVYFSLHGFPNAYNKALQLCKDNIQ